MSEARWMLTDFTEWACPFTYHIIVVTDAPCHLWLRWSYNKPHRHPRQRRFRGLEVMGDVYYCFTAYNDIEQAEAGDTTSHSFSVPGWLENQTRYFYFWGTVAGLYCPSESCIFGRSLEKSSGQFFRRIEYPEDVVTNHGGSTWSYPGNPPLVYPVGRWQTPAQKQGTGLRFRDCPLPHCADVTLAYLTFVSHDDGIQTLVKCQISAENTSYPDDFYGCDTGELFGRWNTRIGVVDWDNVELWYTGLTYYSPNCAAAVQALCNRSDWQPGCNMVIFWDDFQQRTPWWALRHRFARSFAWYPSDAPWINIAYEAWSPVDITVD